jgi:hypothetical protein
MERRGWIKRRTGEGEKRGQRGYGGWVHEGKGTAARNGGWVPPAAGASGKAGSHTERARRVASCQAPRDWQSRPRCPPPEERGQPVPCSHTVPRVQGLRCVRTCQTWLNPVSPHVREFSPVCTRSYRTTLKPDVLAPFTCSFLTQRVTSRLPRATNAPGT